MEKEEKYQYFWWNKEFWLYRNCSKILYTSFSDKKERTNSVDPDQTASIEESDQGLHCLPTLDQSSSYFLKQMHKKQMEGKKYEIKCWKF